MNFNEFIDTIVNDKEYTTMKNKLEALKNTIYSSELLSSQKIKFCESALKLASQIYEYSKNKGYDSLSKQFWGSNPDELELNTINELLEHNKIYTLYNLGYSLEKRNSLELALEKYNEILNNYIPAGSVYYERPAILLEKLKHYEEAIKVCDLAIQNQQENGLHFSKEDFEYRKNRLLKKLNKNSKTTNKTNPNTRTSTNDIIVFSKNDIINNKQNIEFPNWYISISFGKSSSKNYPQAVTLAKLAPQYIENNIEGKLLHQSIYSDNFDEYLQFIKLYELISKWKSCFVVINGHVVDRKIISRLNYCYGDKCRSGNPNFCYGASYMTDNPFGCHRIQISRFNNPWWSFGMFDTSGVWHVDKNAISDRILEYSQPYKLCPCFSLEKIKNELNKLPNTINPNNNKDWKRIYDKISPTSDINDNSLTIKLDIPAEYENKVNGKCHNISIIQTYCDKPNKHTKETNRNTTTCNNLNQSETSHHGCLTTILIVVFITFLLRLML